MPTENYKFPADFVWGAATSSYQIEGAVSEDGKGEDIWDVFTKEDHRIFEHHTGETACDHYHRFKEDVKLMKEIGLHAYRFSINWSRVLPNGYGQVNEKGIAFYNALINELLANDIEPYITLYHWELPYELYKRGGWLNPQIVDWFGDYARLIAERFSDRVKNFFTLNEPQCFVGLGFLTGEHEPRFMDARELPADITELAQVLENVDVLGRVLPDQKKAIVEALHAGEHVVAMTGDGVNDALAIKEADLGIAMGNAAPATKAVAQVVLVDSKFSHLPDVVARGRQVMANMERVASLFLVKTVYSALISLGVVLTQIPYPYLPRHITYIGALTIGMPAFILALAPNTRRYIPGFLKRVVTFALPGGIATALSVLLAAWVLPPVMGWNVTGDAADLSALRATSAIILFAMGVFVLARVARPLNGWRGVLVAVFAAAGVFGAFVPFVANFFALILPTGATMVATLIALAGSALIFALCLWLAPLVRGLTGKLSRRH